MAIKGVSLAEREDYILKDDPAHPDNIKAEVERKRKVAERNGVKLDDEMLASIEGDVRTEAGEPTVFHIGNLTKADRIEVGDMTASPTMRGDAITMTMKRVERAYAIVQRGLKGWQNMLDHHGNPVKFDTQTVQNGSKFVVGASDECLSHLAQDDIAEIANAILDKNGMRGALEKNLEGASQQPEDQPFGIGGAQIVQTPKNENGDALNPQSSQSVE